VPGQGREQAAPAAAQFKPVNLVLVTIDTLRADRLRWTG
jgi:hypothetical protein